MAKIRIDFAIFTFSESSGIDDHMNVVVNTGMGVSWLVNGDQQNFNWSSSNNLDEDTAIGKNNQAKFGKYSFDEIERIINTLLLKLKLIL